MQVSRDHMQARLAGGAESQGGRAAKNTPMCSSRILQLKGFGGGVPLNTETTTVKDLWPQS
jgi:hypothetical protein